MCLGGENDSPLENQLGSPLFPIVVQWSKIGALTELYILETLILISDSEIHCCFAVVEKDELCKCLR